MSEWRIRIEQSCLPSSLQSSLDRCSQVYSMSPCCPGSLPYSIREGCYMSQLFVGPVSTGQQHSCLGQPSCTDERQVLHSVAGLLGKARKGLIQGVMEFHYHCFHYCYQWTMLCASVNYLRRSTLRSGHSHSSHFIDKAASSEVWPRLPSWLGWSWCLSPGRMTPALGSYPGCSTAFQSIRSEITPLQQHSINYGIICYVYSL